MVTRYGKRATSTYSRAWISVKATYQLTANPAEAAALSELLDTCEA